MKSGINGMFAVGVMVALCGCTGARLNVKPMDKMVASDGAEPAVLIPAIGGKIVSINGIPCDSVKYRAVNPVHLSNFPFPSDDWETPCVIDVAKTVLTLPCVPIIIFGSFGDERRELRCVAVSPGKHSVEFWSFGRGDEWIPNQPQGKFYGPLENIKPGGIYLVGCAKSPNSLVEFQVVASEEVPKEVAAAVRQAMANSGEKPDLSPEAIMKLKQSNPLRKKGNK